MPEDHLSLHDGGALVTRETCTCGTSVTLFHGVWWNDNDTPHDCDENSFPIIDSRETAS